MIGIASIAMLLLFGRIAGVSGIIANGLHFPKNDTLWRFVFVAGILSSGAFALMLGAIYPMPQGDSSWVVLIIAGLLVGFGSRLGSGCTSGHGICGISRLSARSIVATTLFILSGIITVALTNLFV